MADDMRGYGIGPAAGKNPLSAQHYDALVNAQREYHDLLPEYDRAERCGIACAALRSDAQRQVERIGAILREYFPAGRPRE